MRQTLHLVTRRDYALLRAALSETNFPDQSEQATRLAPSARAFASKGIVTTAEVPRVLRGGARARGVRRPARLARRPGARAHPPPPRDRAVAGPSGGRFAAADEPDEHDPTEARAEMLRRYLAAFGPVDAAGHRRLEHDARARDLAGARAARAVAPLPGRRRPRAPRRPAGAAPRRRDAGSRALAAQVGQRSALLGRPHPHPARGIPQGRDPDERRRRADLPRRRFRGGRGASRASASSRSRSSRFLAPPGARSPTRRRASRAFLTHRDALGQGRELRPKKTPAVGVCLPPRVGRRHGDRAGTCRAGSTGTSLSSAPRASSLARRAGAEGR